MRFLLLFFFVFAHSGMKEIYSDSMFHKVHGLPLGMFTIYMRFICNSFIDVKLEGI